MAVGIKQKRNVCTIVEKVHKFFIFKTRNVFVQLLHELANYFGIQFLSENFTIILFHYDGNLDGWSDLDWSREAVHIVAHNQTKW